MAVCLCLSYSPGHVLALPQEEVQVRVLACACCSRKNPGKGVKDSHSPQIMKFQLFLRPYCCLGWFRYYSAAEGARVRARNRRLFDELQGVWQRFATNRAILPQVIQAERVINRLFLRCWVTEEKFGPLHSIQAIENEGHIEMRVGQVYRQSLQMAHFIANRCHIPNPSVRRRPAPETSSSKSIGCRPPRHIHNPLELMLFARWHGQRIDTVFIFYRKVWP
jgi:hypothetical protein